MSETSFHNIRNNTTSCAFIHLFTQDVVSRAFRVLRRLGCVLHSRLSASMSFKTLHIVFDAMLLYYILCFSLK
jgi:hypothetical protein